MKLQLNNFFRDYTAEQTLFARRAIIAFTCILVLSGILIANLYYLQVLRFQDYSTRSNQNRIKLMPIAPSRGIIYDRNGIPLAINRTIYQIELTPAKTNDLKRTIQDITPIIDLTSEDIDSFEKERKGARRFSSIPLKTSLTDLQVARFALNQYRFPGLVLKSYQRRYYPHGQALSHVLGYVSKINDRDIAKLEENGRRANYSGTHDIGKIGIEAHYEEILHGKVGYEEVEINNRGRVVRLLQEHPPQAGKDLYLSIDLPLQRYIENLLTGSRAAVVASDPRTGEILAMASTPTYDPNLFVNGISSKDYNALLQDNNRPLYNRVIQASYPPASTVKPYLALSALDLGLITPNTTIIDPGWWQLPGTEKRYRDWQKWGHGRVNVTKAIEESADTFFYQIAYDMGIDRLSTWMEKFGYGHRTGIDLPQENAGNMPTRAWKKKRFNKTWYQGDTISVGIGQGYWTATPMQMNNALTIFINEGEIKTPHLLKGTYKQGSSVAKGDLNDIPSSYWSIIKDGMYGVANRSNGTAYRSFHDAPYKIAAKSGTAQVFGLKENETYNASKVIEHLRDHKMMIAFAPYDNPSVAITVILENGGVGPTVGKLTRSILDFAIQEMPRSSAEGTISPNITKHETSTELSEDEVE